MLGSEFGKLITGKSGIDRESLIYNAVISGQVPAWIKDDEWKQITILETIGGIPHTLKLWVIPDYFAVGTSDDFLRIPMWPTTAQKVADYFHAILPTRKIVDAIYQQADARTSIGPPKGFVIPGPDMEDSKSFIASSAEIDKRFAGKTGLKAGGKKDVVIGPGLDGSHVAIYSSPFSGTGPVRPPDFITKDGVRIPQYQSYPAPHVFTYSDYSHGIRLVFGMGELDDKLINLVPLFQSPLWQMVSDQGAFEPRFPNAKPGGGTKVTYPPKNGGTPPLPPAPPVTQPPSQSSAFPKVILGGTVAVILARLLLK